MIEMHRTKKVRVYTQLVYEDASGNYRNLLTSRHEGEESTEKMMADLCKELKIEKRQIVNIQTIAQAKARHGLPPQSFLQVRRQLYREALFHPRGTNGQSAALHHPDGKGRRYRGL